MALTRIDVQTHERTEMVDVTREVAAAVRATAVRSGVAFVYCPHTTAGVTIQENADPDVQHDLLLALESAVPLRAQRGHYRHAEGNSDAHVKASLVGSSAAVPVEDGVLVLGTWQGIFLCEFDGPRTRTLQVRMLPG